jgi:hypothetical protein
VAERALDAFNQCNLEAHHDVFTQDSGWSPTFPDTVDGDGYLGREGIEKDFGEVNDVRPVQTVTGERRPFALSSYIASSAWRTSSCTVRPC